MGNQCGNLCELAETPLRGNLQLPDNTEVKPLLYQMPINLKTSRTGPDQYFSMTRSQRIDALPTESIIHCENDVYVLKMPDGATYHGQLYGEKREGFGTQVWSDKATYTGLWNDNEAHGQGKFTHPSGDYYEGEWFASRA